jgi:hypothetical protein
VCVWERERERETERKKRESESGCIKYVSFLRVK